MSTDRDQHVKSQGEVLPRFFPESPFLSVENQGKGDLVQLWAEVRSSSPVLAGLSASLGRIKPGEKGERSHLPPPRALSSFSRLPGGVRGPKVSARAPLREAAKQDQGPPERNLS